MGIHKNVFCSFKVSHIAIVSDGHRKIFYWSANAKSQTRFSFAANSPQTQNSKNRLPQTQIAKKISRKRKSANAKHWARILRAIAKFLFAANVNSQMQTQIFNTNANFQYKRKFFDSPQTQIRKRKFLTIKQFGPQNDFSAGPLLIVNLRSNYNEPYNSTKILRFANLRIK